jgi:phosphate transport system substrate-binding protein
MHLECTSNNSFSRGLASGVALALLLAICGLARAADLVRIGGTTAALGTIHLLAEKFTQSNPGIKIILEANLASEGGVKALQSRAIELAVVSRPLNEREIKNGLSQQEYARTPFVLAVSTKSDVRAITRRELADIFSGEMASWPDGTTVRPVLRPANNSNNASLKRLAPAVEQGVSAAERRPGMQVVITDQEAAEVVERVPGAIGAISLAVILSERRALKALALDGVDPTPANAAAKAYPLYKSLSFVTAAKRPAAVERFIAFVRSPAGHKILADNGHWVP